jgi:CHAT domain-containing protein/tetratricopeptide (TPR) repeat protein
VAAQSALGLGPFSSNAPHELFERNHFPTRILRLAISRFSRYARGRWIARVGLMLLASLPLLLGTASAIGAGSGFVPGQAIAGSSSVGQADNDVRQLEVGKPIERELAGGQHHSYQVTLTPGQFLHVAVEPHGIAVTATVFGPDGKSMMKLAMSAGSSEQLFLVAQEQRIYRIEIRSKEGVAAGSYLVEMEELRVATPKDTNRALAQSIFADGEQLREQASSESRRKAIEKYARALPLWRAAGDRRGEAETLDELGSVCHDLGETEKALEYLTRALPLFRLVGDRSGEAQTLNETGAVYDLLGERQKALDYYNQALPLRRTVADRDGEARTLNGMGAVYDELGERQKALDYYNQALPLRRMVGDCEGEGATLNNMGLVYNELGQRQKALDYYNQALPLRRAVGDSDGGGVTLNNIGEVYDELGDRQKALDYYHQALLLWRAVGDRPGEAVTLNNIGEVYDELRERQKALDYYHQALLLWRAVGDRPGEGTTLNNIGRVDASLGQTRKSLDYFNRALRLVRSVGDREMEADTLNNIGMVYNSLEDRQKALDYYNQALPLRRSVGDREGEATTLGNIALVERESGNLGEALVQIELAIKIIESLRTEVLSEELRASYFSTVQNNYALYIDLLMGLHQLRPADGNEARALEVSERARARSLLEILAEAQADIHQGVDPALLERERSLGQLLKGKEAVQVELLNGNHTEEQAVSLKKEIEEILAQYEQVEGQIRAASPRYAALTQPQPLSAPEIQQQLDANTLLLEYAMGEEHSYLWVAGPDLLRSFQLPKRSNIETAARRFYELLTAANKKVKGETEVQRRVRLEQAEAQYPQAAAALSKMLLAPVASLLKGKRLVFVADGALQYIPFSALPEPQNGKTGNLNRATTTISQASIVPLVVRHEIISLPSASILAVLRRETNGRQLAPKVVAVLADPVFDSHDPRVVRSAQSSASGAKQEQKTGATRGLEEAESASLSASLTEDRLTRSASEVGLNRSGELQFPRLTFSRREAEAIIAAAPSGKGMMAVDFKASLQTATDPELAHYGIVHFATHGLLNSADPELSGLVLSLVDQQGRPLDGFLQLQDIYNLNLPADLVVLSACETGLGKEIRGEGLMGLTRGFMYAGASRVIASLWKVDDVATAELMERLYYGMLTKGMQPASALRRSQIEMWKQKRWESPYYWAAFVIQGEWR